MGYKTKSMIHMANLADVNAADYYGQEAAKRKAEGGSGANYGGRTLWAPSNVEGSVSPSPNGKSSKWGELGELAVGLVGKIAEGGGGVGKSTDKFDKKIFKNQASGKNKRAARIEKREANWDRKQNIKANTISNAISKKQNIYSSVKGASVGDDKELGFKERLAKRREKKPEDMIAELGDNRGRRARSIIASEIKSKENKENRIPNDILASESNSGNVNFNKGSGNNSTGTGAVADSVSSKVLNKRIKEKQKAEGIVKMNPKGAQRLPSLRNETGFSNTMQNTLSENNTVQNKDHSTALVMAQKKWPRREYISTKEDGMYKFKLLEDK